MDEKDIIITTTSSPHHIPQSQPLDTPPRTPSPRLSTSNLPPPPPITSLYPEYNTTTHLDALRKAEYPSLATSSGPTPSRPHTYLDYTGSSLPSLSQLAAHHTRITTSVFGNPHSVNPSSSAATQAIERARARILSHLGASPAEYTVVFTANATGAARLVGEAYDWGADKAFVATADNHNSVNGLREYARAKGASVGYVPVRGAELRVHGSEVMAMLGATSENKNETKTKKKQRGCMSILQGLRGLMGCHHQPDITTTATTEVPSETTPHSHPKEKKGLFAFPAQSNFTGVRHPLSWVSLAQEKGWDVLLDAAAYLPTSRLDLSTTIKPEFVLVSWYKVLGYPTGVGCLVARHDALERLRVRRPWYAGGTVQASSVGVPWHALAAGASAFEDGTANFQSIPDVHFGLDFLSSSVDMMMSLVETRVRCLTGWFLHRLRTLRHSDGTRMIRLYGPDNTKMRGGTIAFNFVDAEGKVVDERIVARESAEWNISLRTGCFCNPGAGEGAFGLEPETLKRLLEVSGGDAGGAGMMDRYVQMLGLPSAGAVRVSFGIVSNTADVDTFFAFAEKMYRDRVTSAEGLPPR